MGVGLLLGATGCKLGGTRRMLVRRAAPGSRGGVGASTAYDWWWVALLASAGVLAGAGIGFGWLGPLLMVPFAATFVTPTASGTDAVIYGVIVGIAALYGVVIMRRFGAPEVVDGAAPSPAGRDGRRGRVRPRLGRRRRDRRRAGMDGAVLGTRAGPDPDALHPHRQTRPDQRKGDRHRARRRRRTPSRTPRPWPRGTRDRRHVAFILALTQAKTYWLMYGLYTFSLILLLAAPAKSPSKQKNAASRSSSASAYSSSACSSFTLSAQAHETRSTA